MNKNSKDKLRRKINSHNELALIRKWKLLKVHELTIYKGEEIKFWDDYIMTDLIGGEIYILEIDQDGLYEVPFQTEGRRILSYLIRDLEAKEFARVAGGFFREVDEKMKRVKDKYFSIKDIIENKRRKERTHDYT